ncbi:hypothetical protein KO465_01620 [Candidatus Micrarchaeota archaeon]|jgi:hypothetical protein|nr:hypothetical protein [Candidatus Micrarchaeota archaeon]
MSQINVPKIPSVPSKIKTEEKSMARTEFIAIKGPLSMITSWELGDVLLELYFDNPLTPTNINIFVSALNRLKTR